MSEISEAFAKFPWAELYANIKKLAGLLDRMPDKSGENYKFYSQILDYLLLLVHKEKNLDNLKLQLSNQKYYLGYLQEQMNIMEQELLKHKTAEQIMIDSSLMGYKNMLLHELTTEEGKGG